MATAGTASRASSRHDDPEKEEKEPLKKKDDTEDEDGVDVEKLIQQAIRIRLPRITKNGTLAAKAKPKKATVKKKKGQPRQKLPKAKTFPGLEDFTPQCPPTKADLKRSVKKYWADAVFLVVYIVGALGIAGSEGGSGARLLRETSGPLWSPSDPTDNAGAALSERFMKFAPSRMDGLAADNLSNLTADLTANSLDPALSSAANSTANALEPALMPIAENAKGATDAAAAATHTAAQSATNAAAAATDSAAQSAAQAAAAATDAAQSATKAVAAATDTSAQSAAHAAAAATDARQSTLPRTKAQAEAILHHDTWSGSSDSSNNAKEFTHEVRGWKSFILGWWVLLLGLVGGLGASWKSAATLTRTVFEIIDKLQLHADQAIDGMQEEVEDDIEEMLQEVIADVKHGKLGLLVEQGAAKTISRQLNVQVDKAQKEMQLIKLIPYPFNGKRSLTLVLLGPCALFAILKFIVNYLISPPQYPENTSGRRLDEAASDSTAQDLFHMWTSAALTALFGFICSFPFIRFVGNYGLGVVERNLNDYVLDFVEKNIPGGLENLQKLVDAVEHGGSLMDLAHDPSLVTGFCSVL